MNLSAEFLTSARACDSLAKFEELLKANNMELSSKEAESLFAQIIGASELSDESLKDVAGGIFVEMGNMQEFRFGNKRKDGLTISNTFK